MWNKDLGISNWPMMGGNMEMMQQAHDTWVCAFIEILDVSLMPNPKVS